MAIISPDTFNALDRYVNVRLQQGVPLVDADWNEKDDIRKFELQAFLKWFVGNGVPKGTNGFKIESTNAVDDFRISAGITGTPDGLKNVGRCLVDGMDVIIKEDLNFKDQTIDDPNALPIADIPDVNGIVTAYLDVWERLVTAEDDDRLVHDGLGVESCVRKKREWVVRVSQGTTEPLQGDNDYVDGHSYYVLARIERQSGQPITQNDITDMREKQLFVPPATLIQDLFDTDPLEYRKGRNRPAISLRKAINSLLRGEVPSGPEVPIAPDSNSDNDISRGSFFDAANGLITTWSSDRVGGIKQIFASRLSLLDQEVGFSTLQQITTGVAHTTPHSVILNNGDVMVAYETETANENIHLKLGSFGNLNTSLAEIDVATTSGVRERSPFAVSVDGQVVILWHEDHNNTWQFNTFNIATNTFPDSPQALSTTVTTNQRDLHAAKDSTNSVWVAFRTTGNDIHALEVPVGSSPTNSVTHNSGGADQKPFVLVDKDDNVWIFWSAIGSGLWYRRFLRLTNTWEASPTNVPGTNVGTLNLAPSGIIDDEGGIWLFWQSTRSGNQDIWYVRRNPVTTGWGEPRQITGTTEADTNPFVLFSEGGLIWLFWNRQIGSRGTLFYRKIFTSI